MIIPLQSFDYQASREITIPVPRNVNIKNVLITAGTITLGAGTYVANSILNGFRLEYKGDSIFNRTGIQVREINRLMHNVAPVAETWTLEPERGFKGSESNYIYVKCAPIADLSVVAAVSCACTFKVQIETTDAAPAGKRAVDSPDFLNYGTGTGLRKISIPVRKQSTLFALFAIKDGAALADADDAIISVRNETSQKSFVVSQTLKELRLANQAMFSIAHATGLYYLPLNLPQNLTESMVIDFTLVTAGTAVTISVLMVSVLG
jgi:hypothetical protein